MSLAPLLAEVTNLNPETPPLSERLIRLVGFVTWLHCAATITGVVCVCAQAAWARGHSSPIRFTTVLLRAALATAVVVSAGLLLESIIR
ncbi:hypothetical protein [Nocardia sp. CA-135398]|uniref:hypothetical protein n=1 Tax=Nocardia sp. CA-135398 TaxID=3239977 RepID=UPI003D97E96D